MASPPLPPQPPPFVDLSSLEADSDQSVFVFGLENLTFLAKIHILIPKCTEGVGDPPV